MDDLFPLLNAVDIEILMHKEVHFSSSFDVMINYYEGGGVGVMPDFDLGRMQQLKDYEMAIGKNLADHLLPEGEREKVRNAKAVYLELKSVYQTQLPTLLSDLILSEEEEPKKVMDALVKEGKKAAPLLIDLVLSQSFYDPLYPGYGRAPLLAAKVLSRIGDPRAIPPLFQALGQESFFADDVLLNALTSFGEAAKTFLLKVLMHRPFSKDNEHAAIALSSMEGDEKVASSCLKLLKEEAPFFSHYLVFGCSALKTEEEKKVFSQLSEDRRFSQEIRNDIKLISNKMM